MKKVLKKAWRGIRFFLNPQEVLFQEAYAKEKTFWKEGTLPEKIYRSHYDIHRIFDKYSMIVDGGFDLGNPFRVRQIRKEELRVKANTSVSTTMNIWISSIEEFSTFMEMLKERIGEKGNLSLHVNGHLWIIFKWEGELKLLFSNRVKIEEFLIKDDELMNKTFYRGEVE